MDRFIIRRPWLHVTLRTLDINYHGKGRVTSKTSARIVRMDSYAKSWTLYVYDRKGFTYCLNITFPRWRGEWPNDTR